MSFEVPLVSSSAALEGVTAHYGWCVVVCLVADILLIIVVNVGCVASISIVPCIVADGIFCVVCVMVVAVFLVVCVMIDAVSLLIVMFNFFISGVVLSPEISSSSCASSLST